MHRWKKEMKDRGFWEDSETPISLLAIRSGSPCFFLGKRKKQNVKFVENWMEKKEKVDHKT